MMNSPTSSASSQPLLQPTKLNTLRDSDQLTPSEIDLLRQSKKSIADFVQKELPESLKQRHMEHILAKP